ncbi:hypothetical protein LLH06_06125 [Mucilaginibacter daejeonensis]|uniref:hypothetical protein n=1 Tax=Mucilaginibacter daejeonensis TaxID=398049 RepID=UPI001D16FD23|nr:hypothetical protein [Mucilaginibacter daejeonensis]UEG54536.1 hypothetical protein LLH06_06125 [Mucilaginibacter daejeonensis]
MPDKRISELPAVTSVNGDDVSVLVRNGTDQQFNFSQLRSFIADQISTGAQITFVTDKPQDLTGKDLDVAINSTNGKLYQKRSGTWTEAYTPATSASGSEIIYGVGIPAASSGTLNASYVDTANGNFYQKGPSGWRLVFSMLNGPAGPPGPKGDPGSPGVNGRTILSGPLNPSNQSDGSNGDHYINTSTHKLFGPKTNGDWGAGVDMVPGEEVIGDLNDLPTTNKINIVAAIKELADNGIDAGDIDDTLKINTDEKLGVNLMKVTSRTDFDVLVGALVPHPTYDQPVATLTPNVTTTGEVGESRLLTITLSFNQKSAGLANAYSIRKNGTQVTNTASYNDTIKLAIASISYQGTVGYEQGPIQKNIIFLDDPVGRISAGSKDSNIISFSGTYATWYGPAASVPSTAAAPRSLSGKQLTSSGNSFVLNSGTAQTTLVIITAPNRSLASVIDLDALNAVITSEYVYQGTMSVNDADGVAVAGFKIYVKQMGVPYTANHRHQIALN